MGSWRGVAGRWSRLFHVHGGDFACVRRQATKSVRSCVSSDAAKLILCSTSRMAEAGWLPAELAEGGAVLLPHPPPPKTILSTTTVGSSHACPWALPIFRSAHSSCGVSPTQDQTEGGPKSTCTVR